MLASNFLTTTQIHPVSQSFSDTVDPNTGLGHGKPVWASSIFHSGVAVGTAITGLLTLDYDLYSVDPNSPQF